MSDKITVLVVEPMKPCRVQEIPNTLEAMGQVVGGRIESFSYQREAIISNEESKLLDLPLNDALTHAAEALEPQRGLMNAIIGYMGEQHDSTELYGILHDTLGMSNQKIRSLGFDLPQSGVPPG